MAEMLTSPSTAPRRPTVLVLDDEAAIAELVAGIFQAEGFRVLAHTAAADALRAAREEPVDLAIVDIMMPVMDGYEFCRRFQALSDAPVLFLTAKDEETDLVIGFAMGAEDYITKPFKPRELVARAKARLRRSRHSQGSAAAGRGHLEAQGIVVDEVAHRAWLHDIELSLTPKEFAILSLLMRHKGTPVSSRRIYEEVWREAPNASSANTVMVHIRHLRCKLGQVDSSVEFIKTAWGVGYIIGEDRRS